MFFFQGYVETWAAFVIGIILGLTSWLSLYVMKEKLHVDDALDVGSVHGSFPPLFFFNQSLIVWIGVPGIIGALCIGFFSTLKVNPLGANGVFYGELFFFVLFHSLVS